MKDKIQAHCREEKERRKEKAELARRLCINSFGEGDDRGLAFLAEKQWSVVCICKYLIHEFSAVWSFTQTGDLAFVRLIGIKQVVIPANTTPIHSLSQHSKHIVAGVCFLLSEV